MAEQRNKGYFRGGMPYNRFGKGPRVLVVFQGLLFENKPMAGVTAKTFGGMYGSLWDDYTIYIVTRKPGLPPGCTMKDIANDYAEMIKEEFGGPVDVLGMSTGGSIVQHFAADHPELVRRLVIHSSAYTLTDASKRCQLRIAEFARKGKWRAAYAEIMGIPGLRGLKVLLKPFYAFMSLFGGLIFGKPKDPSDLIVTVEAEDKHDFKERLSEIKAPALVIAGGNDPFYTQELFRDTAEGIPGARLILYKGMGHPAMGRQFKKDLYDFLMAK